MYQKTSTPEKNEEINSFLNNELCQSLTSRVVKSKSHRNLLMQNTGIHNELIQTLSYAIQMYEVTEEYELCAKLHKYQTEVINGNS